MTNTKCAFGIIKSMHFIVYSYIYIQYNYWPSFSIIGELNIPKYDAMLFVFIKKARKMRI